MAHVGCSISDTRERVIWRPLGNGSFKVEFDGAVRLNERKEGIGVIIRDFKGKVMGALVALVQDVHNSTLMEAVDVVKALEFAKDLGFGVIELEGDSISIMNRIDDTNLDLSHTGVVLDEGRCLNSLFMSCKVLYTLREGNKVAHALAQYGVNQSG
ncbi:hypothetical protein PTKIN_Ptkin06aG0095400 [Pterospermum kingtungense]